MRKSLNTMLVLVAELTIQIRQVFKYDPRLGGGFCDPQPASSTGYEGVGPDDVTSLKYLHTF